MKGRTHLTAALVALLLITGLVPPFAARPAAAASVSVVISQVYSGGGATTGSPTYKNDYVELFNLSTNPVIMTGWSLQYGSASGNFGSGATLIYTFPAGTTLGAGQYLLVQTGTAGTVGGNLPVTPDLVTTNLNMSATSGKVALSNQAGALGCGATATPCPLPNPNIVDLVSWGASNNGEGGTTVNNGAALVNTQGSVRKGAGCTDTDNNNLDFDVVTAPVPRNSSTALHVCPVGPDAAPAVTGTAPANGATAAAVNANITVTFSEAVNVAPGGFNISCATSGGHTAAVSGGPTTFTLNPDVNFAFGETCTVNVLASAVTDQDLNDPPDNMAANYVFSFTNPANTICSDPFTPISQIQGSGATVAITGPVTTQGVVVGDYEGASPALRGFFIQDPAGDGDPATSDGIFVFEGSNADTVSLGDVVRVSGTAGENQGQSQVSVGVPFYCSTGTVAPTDVTLPFAAADFPERYEGMLVRMPQTLYVTEHFQLGRFGQVVMSSGARLHQPTNVVAPGAPAQALQAANSLNRIIVDDDNQTQNPDPIQFGRGGNPLSASNTLRGGDTATGMVGVLNYTWAGASASGNAYRLRPVGALGGGVPDFQPANPRPAGPPVAPAGSTLRAVGMNLLNFFNTFADSNPATPGCYPSGTDSDCRGANSQVEFDRQWAKTVAAITIHNADVIGYAEMENDGYGPDSAVQFLVDRLNDATAPGTYAFIDPDAATGQDHSMGTDAIKVGLIYKPGKVTPVGATAVLNTTAFVNGGTTSPRNRPAIAQAFQQNGNGARFIMVVNHLKSKGCASDATGGDVDTGDGQSCWNATRVNAANALTSWLASDPTGTGDPDVLMVGDYNAYAKEDPAVAIENAGFTDLVAQFEGPDAYSYVFDGQWGYLDYGFASAGLVGQVTGAQDWHIDADEPSVLDYNTNFKTAGQIAGLYAPDQFRISDHDPVVVDLALNAAPVVAQPVVTPEPSIEGQPATAAATFADPDPDDGPFTCTVDYGDGSGPVAGVVSGNTCTGPAHVYTTYGTYNVTVAVTDRHGYTGSATAAHTVIFAWTGFMQPVQYLPILNTANAGSSVPLKFSLGGDKGLGVVAAGSPTSQRIDCDTLAVLDDVQPAMSVDGLTYDAAAGQYNYVWKTAKGYAGTCRQFVLVLVDGTTHLANFDFRK